MRIPQAFKKYFNQTEIVKALNTKNFNEARKLCKLVTAETTKLMQTLKLGIFPENQERLMVNQYLVNVLSKKDVKPLVSELSSDQLKFYIL
jgi:hypothetical protein